MRDFADDLSELRRRVTDARAYLRVDAAEARLAELEQAASKPDLWDDPDAARQVTSELARVKDDIDLVHGLEEADDSVEPEIAAGVANLAAELDRLELRALFMGEHDERDAICEVHSG